jgi:hypothetical protein
LDGVELIVKPTFFRSVFILPKRIGEANEMKRKLIAAIFWGIVIGVAIAAGLTGVSGLGILVVAAFAVISGVIRIRLSSWSSNQEQVQT